MAKLKEKVIKQEFQKKYTRWLFNSLAESAILMALDNPDSLGDKVASCRRRKGLLMNTKNIKRHDCYYWCNKYTIGVKFKENASY